MIHYIIARRDYIEHIIRHYNKTGIYIGNPSGVLAAQVTHAAGESFGQWAVQKYQRLEHQTGGTAIVLAVSNERRLRELEQKLRAAHIRHVAIREPDAPWKGQLMTIGLWPIDEKGPEQQFLKRLKLL